MSDFDSLKTEFKRYFEALGYGPEDFHSNGDAQWVYAVVDRKASKADPIKSGFHYELICRAGEFYMELHFEFYKNQWPEMRSALQCALSESEHKRHIMATSYYSSMIWRVRTPIVKVEDIATDIAILKKAVDDAYLHIGKTVKIADALAAESQNVIELNLPYSLKQIAHMLDEGAKEDGKQDKAKYRLTIPSVQRGKVWNAARIETLWDSIFRDIPIGALSVRKRKDDCRALDLLDGQQRATAIALGYNAFPAESSKFESILWIDLDKHKEGRYNFYVTTASQPWGYADSASETKNTLLSLGERRAAAKDIPLGEGQVKPYAYQLCPVRASAPVPYTLLREYAEEMLHKAKQFSFAEFCQRVEKLTCGLVRAKLEDWKKKCADVNGEFVDLCQKILDMSDSYSVFLLDAGSVADEDIALYFSRIGKGGVVPSDEELAYSVLKSKLDDGFRKKIEDLHREYGIASQSRIAHLAIRFFKSMEKGNQFYSGSVFSAVVDMCKDGNENVREEFNRFIKEDLSEAISSLYKNNPLTQWHMTRYASERNGDVFLFLLIANRRNEFDGYNVFGVAELFFSYSSHTDYAIRKVFEEGLQVGVARLLKETHYNSHRLVRPTNPTQLVELREKLKSITLKELSDWRSANPDTAEFISQGYGSSPHARALNILIFACRRSRINNSFVYNKELGVWSEESCPWDYDHVMPHSTIEKMPNSMERVLCEWLKNSIGNLAPIPFSLNRSLSDSERDKNYPFCKGGGVDHVGNVQAELVLNGDHVASMWKNGQISPIDFCVATLDRFIALYLEWYDKLGINEILNFEGALSTSSPSKEVHVNVCKRWSGLSKVKESFPEMTYKRIVADNKEEEIPSDGLSRTLCAEDWITLSCETGGVSVAVTKYREGGKWQIGLRKSGNESSTDAGILDQVKDLFKRFENEEVQHLSICHDSPWWYLCDEYDDDEVASVMVPRVKLLMAFAAGMPGKGGGL